MAISVELGSLQIRDGLHILGHVPEGDQLCNLLRALTRIPNGDIPSLRAEVALGLGFELTELLENRGKRLANGDWSIELDGQKRPCVTHADVIEVVDGLCLNLIQELAEAGFSATAIHTVVKRIVEPLSPYTAQKSENSQFAIHNSLITVLTFICDSLVPLIHKMTLRLKIY